MVKIDEYDLKLGEAIQNLKGYEDIDIWSRFHNELGDLWGRNFKDKILIETLMEIPVPYYDSDKYQSNFRFSITPEQARDIIKTLNTILKNRKKSLSNHGGTQSD